MVVVTGDAIDDMRPPEINMFRILNCTFEEPRECMVVRELGASRPEHEPAVLSPVAIGFPHL